MFLSACGSNNPNNKGGRDMPRISPLSLLETREQPVLSIRTRTSVEQLPALIGESYGKLAAYLGRIGHHPSDIPFVAYYNMDTND
jgi:hypothetical protein